MPGELHVRIAQFGNVVRVYLGVDVGDSDETAWKVVEVPVSILCTDAAEPALIQAAQSEFPDEGDALGKMAFASLAEWRSSPTARSGEAVATEIHAAASIAASAEHERYSFGVLAFMGVLGGFLFDQELSGVPLWGTVAFGAMSLIAGVGSVLLGHVMATARVGTTLQDSTTERLERALIKREEWVPAIESMARFQESLMTLRIEKYFVAPLLDATKSMSDRIVEMNQRLSRAAKCQADLMRGQLVGAAISAAFFTAGALWSPGDDPKAPVCCDLPSAASAQSAPPPPPVQLPPTAVPPTAPQPANPPPARATPGPALPPPTPPQDDDPP